MVAAAFPCLTPLAAAAPAPEPFPSPFDEMGPHPWALEAALLLQAQLRGGEVAPGVSTAVLQRPEGGKMFGVLVVRGENGRLAWLKAYSGQMDGAWELPGWVPPMFDARARTDVEPAADGRVKALTAQIEMLEKSVELAAERQRMTGLRVAQGRKLEQLRVLHAERKRRRHALRGLPEHAPTLSLLDEESRQDDRERRRLESALEEERASAGRSLHRLERRLAALGRLRAHVSRRAMQAIHDTYRPTSWQGERTSLRELFAPGEPSWGAGDCAAPKLLSFARDQGLTPLALAEFWWGPPPPGGGRVEGAFYPACRVKCGPLIPFLLRGLEVAPKRVFRIDGAEPGELIPAYEDERVVAFTKPAGLLSVPGTDAAVTDTVLARLRAKYPRATGPLLVHRLDQDTSGLLLAALDEEAYRFLQAQFIARQVHKRYIAWLEGSVLERRGTVRLPLRVDLEQRPRQLVDPEHGREAVTDWEVLARQDGRTRVALFPKSGRTHQLRVHAAHPMGMGAPIVGDRLYGREGGRLMLHAEELTFMHPAGHPVTVRSPAPF